MSEVVYPHGGRDHRGFRRAVARRATTEGDEMFEPTHKLARAVTLWYGYPSPITLPAGTAVRVLDHDEHVVRFAYDGTEGYAIADADAVDLADSAADARASTWSRPPTAGSAPSGDSRRSSSARSSSGTPRRSRSSSTPPSTSGTGSSRSSSGLSPTSSARSSSSSSARTPSPTDERTPLEQLLAGEAIDAERFGAALEHLAGAGALPADQRLDFDLEAGTVALSPSADPRSVPDIEMTDETTHARAD